MNLFEAKQILRNNGYHLVEAKNNGKYRWGKYSFSNPTPDTKYVEVLCLLYDAGFDGMSKEEVHKEMGWPTDRGNHSAMWTEMRDEGLVEYDTKTRRWYITDKGDKMLDDVFGPCVYGPSDIE